MYVSVNFRLPAQGMKLRGGASVFAVPSRKDAPDTIANRVYVPGFDFFYVQNRNTGKAICASRARFAGRRERNDRIA